MQTEEFYPIYAEVVLRSIFACRTERCIILDKVEMLVLNLSACHDDIRGLVGELPIALLFGIRVRGGIEEKTVVESIIEKPKGNPMYLKYLEYQAEQ